MTEANQPVTPSGGHGQAPPLLIAARRYLSYLPFPLPAIAAGFIVLTIVTAVIVFVAD